MIEIKPVRTKKDLIDFIKLPFTIYKNDPHWVAPLISEQKKYFNPGKNPYYDHSEVQLFLAIKAGSIAGRISAHTNTQHNKFHNDKIGFFGFFECLDNQETADKLLNSAYEWLKKRGLDTIRGPMNFSTNHECGLLVEGFNSSPFIMMTHNPAYYLKLLETWGFKKSMDLFAYLLPNRPTPEKLLKLTKRLQERGNFTVRPLSRNKKALRKDLETVFTVYSKAWEKNWGFVPATKKEFQHEIDQILQVVRPEFFYLAYVEGVAAGFYVALPDYNQVLKKLNGRLLPFGFLKALLYRNKITSLRIITMGVIKEYQKKGIDTVFYTKTFETANNHKVLKIKNAELSWVLENNEMMNKIARHLGGEIHKRYRIMDKKIN
jgi:GNAT superfamily N-acetyltransferase